MLRKLTFVVISSLVCIVGMAQTVPCLPTWHYRVPITINNTTNPDALTQHQVLLEMNTLALVNAGKMKADGGDIRFKNAAGVFLSHWIENGTMNTANTKIWVEFDNIPMNSNIDFFMFYGQVNANSTADGTATFVHYDNFDGNALDFNKWTYCGGAAGGTIPVVSNGEVTLGSSSAVYNHSITSSTNFPGPVTTEAKVNTVNNGIATIAQVSAAKNGYGMALENVASIDVMRLVSTDLNSTAGQCLTLINQTPTNSLTAGVSQGKWSFTWSKPDEQLASWPGGSFTRTDYLDSSSFSLNKNVTIGTFNNTGSISLDYVFTRKYTPIQPTYTFGSETELVDYVDATTDAPVCVGSDINLMAPTFSGALYNWVGPNGFTSTDQNPTITGSIFANAGKYVLEVSAPTGCSEVYDSVIVSIDSVPVAGLLSMSNTVCKGTNGDVLALSGTTGSIDYWETTNAPAGPWTTISQKDASLTYTDITETKYFRTIVSNRTCGLDTSNTVRITVDENTKGGNLLGNKNICFEFNGDSILLTDELGTIIKWQSKEDGGTWTDVANSTNVLHYTNNTITTEYRVEVKNGVCPAVFSSVSKLDVKPLPVVAFTSESECLGFTHDFVNNSTITDGTIDEYTWRFGDGGSGSVKTPSHMYTSVQTFDVALIATSNFGCVDSISSTATVNPLPSVSFTHTDVCDTSALPFVNTSNISSGSIDNYSWDFGDNNSATTTNAANTYSTYGEYDVVLTATSDFGCIDSSSNEVRVLRRAIVDFTSDSACFGQAINLANLTNTEQDSTTYTWSLGNGGTSTDLNPEVNYTAPGKYEIVLAANTFGQCLNISRDTVVIYPTPIVDFAFDNVCSYDSLRLTNSTTIDYTNVSYEWAFGDSITSKAISPAHLYKRSDSYFITLEATSEFGCTDQKTLMTEIHAVPKADFEANTVCRDSITAFTNLSTIISNDLSYAWDYNDGNVATDEHPVHTYLKYGTYDVKVVTTSPFNCVDSITKAVTVHPIPEVSFISDSVCFGFSTTITNTSSIALGTLDETLWDLGDASNSILAAGVVNEYAEPGTYPVNLRQVSNKGCVHDTTINIVVHPNPVADFTFENECVYNSEQFVNQTTIEYGVMTYDWQFGDDSTSVETSPNHIYQTSGLFPVKMVATSDQGCQDSTVKIIEIYALPLVSAGIDTIVSYGFQQPLDGVCLNAATVVWTPGSTVEDVTVLQTKARPLEKTEYTLEVTDINGCVNSDNVIIDVIKDYKLLVSNVITPNGDGQNDTWKIFNAASFDDISIQIMDRWGKEVYAAKEYQTEWDGNVNLDNLAEGTYIYLITFTGSDQVYKGTVNILR